jgi:NhaA family Na+:H+ antiporter
MATDIAFSIGLLSIFSKRVPIGLMVFLTTFAIVDDIGAILVISVFYSHEVDWISLLYAVGWWSILLLMNTVLKVTRIWIYLLVGCGVWYSIFKAGIHPTIAGVLVAFTIPAFHKGTESFFLARWKKFIRKIRKKDSDVNLSRKFHREKEMEVLENMNEGINKVISPLQLLGNQLENITSYFILPVFALANAGIALQGLDSFPATLTLSAGGAMLIGKVVALFGFSWIAVRLGLATLPKGVRWPHLLGASFLGGIGFTMAIFISNLALSDQTLLAQTKIGILLCSLLAGIAGVLILNGSLPRKNVRQNR